MTGLQGLTSRLCLFTRVYSPHHVPQQGYINPEQPVGNSSSIIYTTSTIQYTQLLAADPPTKILDRASCARFYNLEVKNILVFRRHPTLGSQLPLWPQGLSNMSQQSDQSPGVTDIPGKSLPC